MKFVLAYTICSAISGMCNAPEVSPVEFKNWSDCVKAGAVATITVTNNHIEKFNEEKLYISYFCNEHKGNDA